MIFMTRALCLCSSLTVRVYVCIMGQAHIYCIYTHIRRGYAGARAAVLLLATQMNRELTRAAHNCFSFHTRVAHRPSACLAQCFSTCRSTLVVLLLPRLQRACIYIFQHAPASTGIYVCTQTYTHTHTGA